MTMKTSLRIAGILAIGLIFSGCVIPAPHRRLHQYGVTGCIVSRISGIPIKNVSVKPFDSAAETVLTDASGRFHLNARYGWHGAYFFGPIYLSLFPPFDVPPFSRHIHFAASGYKPLDVLVKGSASGDLNECKNSSRIVFASFDDLFLHVGNVRLDPDLSMKR